MNGTWPHRLLKMMTPLSIRGARRGFSPQHASSQIHVAGALAPPGCFRTQKESRLAACNHRRRPGRPSDAPDRYARNIRCDGGGPVRPGATRLTFDATAAARRDPARRAWRFGASASKLESPNLPSALRVRAPTAVLLVTTPLPHPTTAAAARRDISAPTPPQRSHGATRRAGPDRVFVVGGEAGPGGGKGA
jgi:hypothetical protein